MDWKIEWLEEAKNDLKYIEVSKTNDNINISFTNFFSLVIFFS